MAGLPARLRGRALGFACQAAHGLFALPGYPLTLVGRSPATMVATPADPWPGDADRGTALLSGRFVFAGRGPEPGGDIWSPAGASAEWLAALHGFDWLRDLRALGGDDARHTARQLTADWIANNGKWSLPAWRSDVLGTRLAAWTSHYDTFFASGEDEFRRLVVSSIAAQLRHLDRAMRLETRGAARITALKGRILGSLCFGDGAGPNRALRRLESELDRQVLADGGHVARSPHCQLTVLRDLLEVRAALAAGQQEIPEPLQQAIDRMGPLLRYLRHGDGGLARFNGAGLEDPVLVEAVAEQAAPRGKPAMRAPAMGFERLTAGDLTVIADSGGPPEAAFDDGAHAGALSLEVSDGAQRLIVNCGAAAADRKNWRQAQRATAAHSTAVINDRNSSELLNNGHIGGRCAATTVERETNDREMLVTMRHDGYLQSDGIMHRRRLYLSADGDELLGEDTLSGATGVSYALRFHLHPTVNASLLQSGDAALLKPPGGDAWRLRADAAMVLDQSIYFENAPEPRHTSQIVITGATGAEPATVKWALRRQARRD